MIGNVPLSSSSRAEVADFMELQCLKSPCRSYSAIDAAMAMGILNEEEVDDNIEDEVKLGNTYEALSEIENRAVFSNHKYPFTTTAYSVEMDANVERNIVDLYTFLLLATRSNMDVSSRLVSGVDATLIFEQLCSLVAQNFFGNNSRSFVFGTGGKIHSFKQKIDDLLLRLSEKGYHYRKADDHNNFDKDGKVDVIVHIPFPFDNRKGNFIALGQCKTGTNWRLSLGTTSGQVFSDSYIAPSFVFTPIVFYMVCESVCGDFENLGRRAHGLLFDRSRIMNFLPDVIPNELLSNIRLWNQAVQDSFL